MQLKTAAFSAALLGAAACGGGSMQTSSAGGRLLFSFQDVTGAQWTALAHRRVFFGHQSVGQNIMDGVAEVLTSHPEIGLKVVESENLAGEPAFYHARVGRNEYPLEKIGELVQVADRAFGTGNGVVMVKLCYADAQPGTDARALFEAYRRQIETLRARHPGVTVVHFTMPLTVSEGRKEYFKKKFLLRVTDRDRNVVRNRYNRLLLAYYGGKEPVFDIARLESTRPDGSRLFFMQGADTVYSLAREYTPDGGHLNEVARHTMAEQLLIFLARLSPPAAPGGALRTS